MITFKLQLIALFLIINCGLTFTVIYSAQWHSVTLRHQIVFSDFSVVCLVLDLIYTNQGIKFSPSAISVQSMAVNGSYRRGLSIFSLFSYAIGFYWPSMSCTHWLAQATGSVMWHCYLSCSLVEIENSAVAHLQRSTNTRQQRAGNWQSTAAIIGLTLVETCKHNDSTTVCIFILYLSWSLFLL